MELLDPYAQRPDDPDAHLVLDPYPGEKIGRRVKLALTWQSKAIARDIAKHLRSLTHVDSLSGEADTLDLSLEDRDSRWSGDWRPEFGDTVVSSMESDPWFSDVSRLRFGTFSHDRISLAGPPKVATFGCVSAKVATGLRRRKRTRVWKSVTLKQIAQDIADRAGLTLNFDGSPGFAYHQAFQNGKSDLEFLQDLCKEVGRVIKVTESSLVIFNEFGLDSRPSSGEIDLIGGKVLSWQFDSDDSGRYGSCRISCFNEKTGKAIKFQFPPTGTTIPGLDDNGQTLELSISVSDAAEAKERAEKLLRFENKGANRGTIRTVGDPALVAGVTFDLVNASGFDGKYIITRATHNVFPGFTCDLSVRRCLEAY